MLRQAQHEDLCLSSPWSHYAVAALLGVAMAVKIFPLDFVLGKGPHWHSPLGGDVTTHLVGLRYFLADAWRFPLFQTRLLVPPRGVNIIFTDSLPLFAFFAKLARPLLSPGANYFGLWFLVAWVAQPVAAVYALRGLGIRKLVPLSAAAA